VKIKVTQRHIDTAYPGECDSCPVALAIRDAVDGRPVSVFYGSIVIGKSDCFMPDEVYDFVLDFDAGAPVEPFEFDLDYPGEGD